MTNAEKFYEVFGTRGWVDWDAEYKGEPTIPLSVIEDIKAEIKALFSDEEISVYAKCRLDGLIDRKVKEIEHD